MVVTVTIGLLSAMLYALHDLVAQNVSRRFGVVRVLCWIVPVGAVIVVPVALLVDGMPAGAAQWLAVAYCAGAGACYLATWFTMLRALTVGNLSLVAPLSSLDGLIVALAGIAAGESVTPLLGVGVALAVVGGLLTATEGRARSTAGAVWALLTGVLWASAMLLFNEAGELSWLSQTAWSRATGLILFVPVAVAVLRRERSPSAGRTSASRRRLGPAGAAICLGAGLLELLGLLAMTMAIRRGPLMIAGVTIAQYATATVLLGLFLLGERPRRHQVIGVGCTLVAVSLLSTAG